jgi:hypothetical protein
MKFFIPEVDDPELAEKIYQSAKSFAKMTLGWDTSERRIFSITYTHNGKHHHDEVGKVSKSNNEPIMAILESNAYLVCTMNRGVSRDMPMLVGQDEIISITDFD